MIWQGGRCPGTPDCVALLRQDCLVDSELPEAMDELIELIESMPGAFRGEFQLGYWGGVTEGTDAWSVRFEAEHR
jgi:hypothetical protein